MAGGDPHAIAAEDLPRLRLPYADGLITIDRVRRLPDSPVCRVRPGDPAEGSVVTLVDFVMADPAQAARTATALVRAADLTAVAVHARYAPTAAAALAVCFAGRVRDARAGRGLSVRIVVADHRPELSGPPPGSAGVVAVGGARGPAGAGAAGDADDAGTGLIRVPHIVAIHDWPNGPSGPQGGPKGPVGVTDRVVWEIMSADQHRAWLGGVPGPDRDGLERHLGGLVALAGLVRAPGAQVPHREEVLRALAGGPLTTEAVHRHPGPLLAAAAVLGNREA
ncbi:hypothetical protein BBK14_10670 [Parafrankia soli]|uniref:DUF4192 domain-containing protein n=1 Tax=Parafrankia soli TaxID=2599596 RepID=A0A1S1RA64_9ACTN|nr:hypothetical protein [Parafrankia soli]OHV43090.1 hypothetical protein BBK14_10670 [Parafrankia soli]